MSHFTFGNMLDLKTYILNTKNVVCFSLDLAGNVLFFNPAYTRILGYSEKNIKNNLLNPEFETLTIDAKDGLVFSGIITLKKKGINSSFESKIYKLSNELFFLCEYDGLEVETLFNIMSSNTLVINNMNRELIKKEIMLNNTIAKLKEIQAMLILSEKLNALGQLVAGIAHEINNPMTYVMVNVEIMEQYSRSIKNFVEDCEKEKLVNIESLKKKHDIDYILEDSPALQKATLEGGERIKKIVLELRDYARIDTSEKSYSNIAECITSCVNIANPEIKRENIDLELNLTEVSEIECFPAQLNQVFLNIIVNAIQATGENGKVVIKLYEIEKFVVVEIEDDGPGIPDEVRSKIFLPFFTTKSPGTGVGLGLNLSYKIIKDMHKGEIRFDSIVGKGTTFIISIPKGAK